MGRKMLLDDYEEFTESQRKILERYVTNTSGHIFVLRKLPEVIKGAFFPLFPFNFRPPLTPIKRVYIKRRRICFS